MSYTGNVFAELPIKAEAEERLQVPKTLTTRTETVMFGWVTSRSRLLGVETMVHVLFTVRIQAS